MSNRKPLVKRGNAVAEFRDGDTLELGGELLQSLLQRRPSPPPMGKAKTYFRSDGKFYRLNSVGIETEVGSARASFDRSATLAEGSVAVQTELLPANTRVSAKVTSAGSATRTVTVKLHYHEY